MGFEQLAATGPSLASAAFRLCRFSQGDVHNDHLNPRQTSAPNQLTGRLPVRIRFGEPFKRERKTVPHWLRKTPGARVPGVFSNPRPRQDFRRFRSRTLGSLVRDETRGAVPKCHISKRCPWATRQNSRTLWFTTLARLTGLFESGPYCNWEKVKVTRSNPHGSMKPVQVMSASIRRFAPSTGR